MHRVLFVALLGAATLSLWADLRAEDRPHVVLIMVDDMGFSDLGYHGGEIATPHIDALAHAGVRFSQFYNSGRCCPTRATLMTGLHPHQTGIGWMTQPPNNHRGSERPPAYQGYLNRECATVAEVLRAYGYATLMSGKWHLGFNDASRWPLARGFEKYYGCLAGATRFFTPEHPRGMTLANRHLEQPESTTGEAFYTTDAFTDYAMRFLQEELAGDGRPMFLYLAYTAPHWPLQAFEDDIARYRGKYKEGWDALRAARHRRQIERGLVDPAWPLSPRTPGIPDWESLDAAKRDEMDLKMAVYAAMIDRVDQNIGRLVAFLKEKGIYDNTLLLFLSDNGGCQEGGMLGRGEFYDVQKRNQQNSNSYGEAWANASNTPFRLYKHFAHEGGTATPFFAHWPARITARSDWYREPAQLIDIVPTILDVARAEYPSSMHGNRLPPLDGVSLRPAFDGRSLDRQAPIFIEHENNAFVRAGKWKLVGRGVAATDGVDPSKWELYDMARDRTETRNLADRHPERVRQLAAQWNAWAQRAGVYPKRSSRSAPQAAAQPNPPQVKGRAFTVTATIEHARPHGVVLAHGGLRFGYALHFVQGRPAMSVRDEGKLTELVADEAVSGRVTVTATLDEMEMTLQVDGKVVARRRSPGLHSGQPAIGLYVGQDFQDPVGDYRLPNRFHGTITGHRVTVKIPKVTMRTRWGREVTAENAWQSYPRPALRRSDWTNLNGLWKYAITPGDVVEAPGTWDGAILVPFAVEAPLSGVERRLFPGDALWYRRPLDVKVQPGRRYVLNFEAVDYACTLWINGRKIGSHTGGNLPFSFDITKALETGRNTLTLRVTDATDAAGSFQLHGKQRLNPRGIWYTPVSGIWQTVWMEELPELHIGDVKVTSRTDGTVTIQTELNGPETSDAEVTVVASLGGRPVARRTGPPGSLQLRIPDPQEWSPDTPVLYDLTIQAGEDVVHSYVGIREVGRVRDADGHWRLTLNGKPIFHWGTLDQGWWPDGLLTPPSDEALRSDIEYLKAAGFNTIRKHIKVEPRRFYYHCDRLGMLVWQDHVSSMSNNPEWTRLKPDPEKRDWPDGAHRQFMSELREMIDTLGHHPCIVMWVPFNERWGQHRTVEVGRWVMQYDETRLVNVASGGNFLPVGHVVDHHQYPHPEFPFELGAGGRFDDFVKVVGEFGGHGYPVEGHVWDPNTRNWGYGGLPKDKQEWLERYRESIRRLAALRRQGVAAGIYTQTTDVEGEINGLITYDRAVQKIPAKQLAEIHRGAGLLAATRPPARRAAGPNIITIFIDDMGWSDLSCFGGTAVETEHIDRLAAEGLRFKNFYVNSPICSPSRVALTTGQYPHRWRITSYLARRARNRARGMAQWLDPRAPVLARRLARAGYATGHFGKWHMGGQRDVGDAPRIVAYGFDRSLTNFEGLGPRVLPLCDAYDGKPARKHDLGSAALGGGPIRWEDRSVVTAAFVDEAVRFIDRTVDEGRPFFLQLWPDDVHSPFFPPRPLRAATDGSKRALYYAVLDAMDQQLAPLLDRVRADPRLRNNTLILVASDNGHEQGAGSSRPLRGGKTWLYEGGVRSPLIVWGPGLLAKDTAGSVNESSILCALDVNRSLYEIAGIEPPDGVTLDGENLAGTLLGESEDGRQAPIFWRRPPDRPGTKTEPNPDLAVRDGKWKLYVHYDGSHLQLYDLETDLSETRNVADVQPQVVARLKQAVLRWNAEMPADAGDPSYGEDRKNRKAG